MSKTIHETAIVDEGAIIGDVGHLVDLLPTCLELSGAKYPRSFAGHDLLPLEGRSLLPVLHGKGRKQASIFWEYIGHHAVRTSRLSAWLGRQLGQYKVFAGETGEGWTRLEMTHAAAVKEKGDDTPSGAVGVELE